MSTIGYIRRSGRRGARGAVCLLAAAVIAGCGAEQQVSEAGRGHSVGPGAPLPALGVDVHLDTMGAEVRRELFDRLAGMGATWVRVGAPWYALQPDGRDVSASALRELDGIVADATASGMRTLMVGDQAPDWAGGGSATASNPSAYGDYLGILAKHFRGSGPGAASPAYEIMNEPDGESEPGRQWATPTEYAQVACAAHRAVKSADPDAVVLAGSLDVTDWESWLRGAFDAGLGGCFDVLSAHPYSGPSVLTEIRELAAAHGRPNVQVWATEFGASTCLSRGEATSVSDKGCVDRAGQAAELVSTLRELGRGYSWVPMAVIYEAQDEPDASGGAPERSFGLFEAAKDGHPWVEKPAVAAIRELYGRR